MSPVKNPESTDRQGSDAEARPRLREHRDLLIGWALGLISSGLLAVFGPILTDTGTLLRNALLGSVSGATYSLLRETKDAIEVHVVNRGRVVAFVDSLMVCGPNSFSAHLTLRGFLRRKLTGRNVSLLSAADPNLSLPDRAGFFFVQDDPDYVLRCDHLSDLERLRPLSEDLALPADSSRLVQFQRHPTLDLVSRGSKEGRENDPLESLCLVALRGLGRGDDGFGDYSVEFCNPRLSND